MCIQIIYFAFQRQAQEISNLRAQLARKNAEEVGQSMKIITQSEFLAFNFGCFALNSNNQISSASVDNECRPYYLVSLPSCSHRLFQYS